MALIILAIALILSIASNAVTVYLLTKFHQEEKKELHNRLMSRDYGEFKMSQDYDLELQRKKDQIEKEKKKEEKKPSKEDAYLKAMAENF